MRGRITAMIAGVAAAVGAASTALWARGRKSEEPPKPKTGRPAATPSKPDAPAAATEAPGAEPTAAADEADDLTAIKGLGKVKATKLVSAGVTSYAQIAAWSEDDIAEYGLQTNTSPGQIKREDWVGQAKALAEG